MSDLEVLKQFFADRPAINKVQFFRQAGCSETHLYKVMDGSRPLTPKWFSKLEPVMRLYGFGQQSPFLAAIEEEQRIGSIAD